MKHIETPDKTHLKSVLRQLEEGAYVIPDFQREFEWKPWDIVDLFKSIFMDYYVGTLLLWKAGRENINVLKCEEVYGFEGKGKPQHIVLDGQQRLTAIHYAVFSPDVVFPERKSKCHFFVRLAHLLEDNFEEAFYYKWETKKIKALLNDPETQYKDKVFPLSVMQDTRSLIKWIDGYKAHWANKYETPEKAATEGDQIDNLVTDLLENYHISFIELDRDIEIAKVCEIFTKINSKGVPLSIFDLLNAILRPHEVFLKDLWRDAAEDLSYLDQSRMKIFVLQLMSILKQSYCSPKYLYYLVPEAKKTIRAEDGKKKEITLIQDKNEFESNWHEAIDGINKTIMALKNPRDFGAILSKFLPYPTIIPVLSAIRKHVAETPYPDKATINKLIKMWYWASIFTQNYSSAVESQSAKDFNDLKNWFEDTVAEPEVVTQIQEDYKNIDLKGETKQGTAIYNAIFNILVINEAKDWETFDLPEYSILHDHHIVPFSKGKELVGNDINSILNRTPLCDETNKNVIRDKMPNEYLKKMFEEKDEDEVFNVLESHLISRKAVQILLRENFSKDDYYEFIKERERTIKDEIAKLVFFRYDTLPKPVDHMAVIKELENEQVEFKSSLRWCYNQSKIDKDIEFYALKEIIAFLNTRGGTLYIGVDDEGNVLGLENDYKTLGKKKSGDEFSLKLSELISVNLGTNNHDFIKTSIEKVDDKEICVVDVEPSNKAVYYKNEDFFIRAGTSVRQLKGKELTDYINSHWD